MQIKILQPFMLAGALYLAGCASTPEHSEDRPPGDPETFCSFEVVGGKDHFSKACTPKQIAGIKKGRGYIQAHKGNGVERLDQAQEEENDKTETAKQENAKRVQAAQDEAKQEIAAAAAPLRSLLVAHGEEKARRELGELYRQAQAQEGAWKGRHEANEGSKQLYQDLIKEGSASQGTLKKLGSQIDYGREHAWKAYRELKGNIAIVKDYRGNSDDTVSEREFLMALDYLLIADKVCSMEDMPGDQILLAANINLETDPQIYTEDGTQWLAQAADKDPGFCSIVKKMKEQLDWLGVVHSAVDSGKAVKTTIIQQPQADAPSTPSP